MICSIAKRMHTHLPEFLDMTPKLAKIPKLAKKTDYHICESCTMTLKSTCCLCRCSLDC